MRPPSPTPRSITAVALGVWAIAMAAFVLTVATGHYAFLGGLLVAGWVARRASPTRPPPAAAVQALGATPLGFEGTGARTLTLDHRSIHLLTPKDTLHKGTFVVTVAHALPLPDHTWATSDSASRHAPTDLRPRAMVHRPPPLPGTIAVLTDEHVAFHLPHSAAPQLAAHLPALVAWTDHLERWFIAVLVDAHTEAGLTHVILTDGGAGSLVFDSRHGATPVRVRFGRFIHGRPHWRGRPELRVQVGRRPSESVFIGPCTRSIPADLQSALPRLE